MTASRRERQAEIGSNDNFIVVGAGAWQARTVKHAMLWSFVLGACATTPPAPPIYASSSASAEAVPSATAGPAPAVQVFVDKRVPRPTEVVGVLDFHSDAASEEKGFDELRARAAALGADAVLGAEFEHGEAGAPSHLSGIAVRFLDP